MFAYFKRVNPTEFVVLVKDWTLYFYTVPVTCLTRLKRKFFIELRIKHPSMGPSMGPGAFSNI